jgi:hypothetical protein
MTEWFGEPMPSLRMRGRCCRFSAQQPADCVGDDRGNANRHEDLLDPLRDSQQISNATDPIPNWQLSASCFLDASLMELTQEACRR